MKCTVNQPINLIRTYFAACSVHIRIEWCFFCNVDYYPVRYYIISTLGRRFEQNKANEEKKRLLIENEVIYLEGTHLIRFKTSCVRRFCAKRAKAFMQVA